jgi:uncharacterized protein YuzB (UPF0349 family)
MDATEYYLLKMLRVSSLASSAYDNDPSMQMLRHDCAADCREPTCQTSQISAVCGSEKARDQVADHWIVTQTDCGLCAV